MGNPYGFHVFFFRSFSSISEMILKDSCKLVVEIWNENNQDKEIWWKGHNYLFCSCSPTKDNRSWDDFFSFHAIQSDLFISSGLRAFNPWQAQMERLMRELSRCELPFQCGTKVWDLVQKHMGRWRSRIRLCKAWHISKISKIGWSIWYIHGIFMAYSVQSKLVDFSSPVNTLVTPQGVIHVSLPIPGVLMADPRCIHWPAWHSWRIEALFQTAMWRCEWQPRKSIENPGNMGIVDILVTGKHTKNYGKSPFSMGKSTISTGPFSIAILNYQRVVTGNKIID